MASYNDNRNNGNDLLSWIITIIFLVSPIWPVGLIMLFRKLLGPGTRRTQQPRHPYDIQRGAVPGTQGMGAQKTQQQRYTYPYGQPGAQGTFAAQARRQTPPPGALSRTRQGKPVNLNSGKGLTIGGTILAVLFGIPLFCGLPVMLVEDGVAALAYMSPVIGFFCGGLGMACAGVQRGKKARRFRKYLALIGKRDSISITSLAQAMPASVRRACDDLQEMLDTGILEKGYLDMGSGRLILSDEGLTEEQIPDLDLEEDEDKDELDMNDDNAVLSEIRRVNDAIADPVMSAKIDRIGAITGKIFAYQKQNPNKASQLRSFLSYYLPTTLKILKAYAQMEAQGIEGENIRGAKERIEGMMDKVVEGFENQLDKLFQDSAMDITTDVEVLERMLEKDGLSGGGSGMTLGG